MQSARLGHVCWTLVCTAIIGGCSAESEIEIRGSTRSFADLGGSMWVLVADAEAFDDGDESSVIAQLAQQRGPGDFSVTVETDAKTLEVFAIRDDDESRTCSQVDDTARVRVTVGDAGQVDVPELDVSGSRDSGLALGFPDHCPSYAARF